MVADRRVGAAGHRLQLHVRHGNAGRRVHYTFRPGSGLVAHPRRRKFGRGHGGRLHGDGHRFHGRRCGRFGGRGRGFHDQAQIRKINLIFQEYAHRITGTENKARHDDGAGHHRRMRRHLRLHRMVLHFPGEQGKGPDIHPGRRHPVPRPAGAAGGQLHDGGQGAHPALSSVFLQPAARQRLHQVDVRQGDVHGGRHGLEAEAGDGRERILLRHHLLLGGLHRHVRLHRLRRTGTEVHLLRYAAHQAAHP